MSPCTTEQLGQLSLITDPASSLKIDCQPSDCTEEHYASLPGMEHSSVELRKNIWLFIYMAQQWTLPNRLINITLHIHIRVYLWLAIWCIMTCIMIVSHTNRLDNFSQSPCTVPSCRYFLLLYSYTHQVGTVLQSVYPRINNQPMREAAGGRMVYRHRDAKKHTIKAFLVIQRWSNIPMNTQVLYLWRE